MEIHHPHHHDPPAHKEKLWKHYVLEFFMLFLAVTAGFYAENFREDLKNKHEIQSDMQSLVSDLKSDVAYFDSALASNEYACAAADSLVMLLNGDRSNTNEIYFLARACTANFSYYFSNEKTFDQMKSSDALKLISPRSLLDSISDYYTAIQFLANHTELERMKLDDIHLGNSQLFNSYEFQKMMHVTYSYYQSPQLTIKRPEGNPPLLTTDFNKINDVAMRYHYFYANTKFYSKTAILIHEKGKRLMEMIQNEYHLE